MSAAETLIEAETKPAEAGFRFDTTYAHLPERFFVHIAPAPAGVQLRPPRVIRVNRPLAETLGLDAAVLESDAGARILGGEVKPEGAAFIALAYAGHQYGHFVPQLGDGRAVLLGEVVGRDGQRRDLQLKGSGPTPFSRMGDGRAALGPVLREYIVSEAMHALGVPTTRALAAVATGAAVFRETVQPGGVFSRVAASHVRVGTFQYFAARGDTEALRLLADHVLARHDPEAARAPDPYAALLRGVVARQADLVARWLLLGFVHGVMNTDNTTISGETIDYGPCAFMEAYDPATVFSSIDQFGRYAYANQPRIMHWNLTRLAEAMLPLLGESEDQAVAAAEHALQDFRPRFETAWQAGLRGKLGLARLEDGDAALTQDFLAAMEAGGADFSLAFRRLADAARGPAGDDAVRALFTAPDAFDAWASRWRARLAREGRAPEAIAAVMDSVNPAYIPRNHLVEAALEAAMQRDDFGPFHALVDVLAHPFALRPGLERYTLPATQAERVLRTYCGT